MIGGDLERSRYSRYSSHQMNDGDRKHDTLSQLVDTLYVRMDDGDDGDDEKE
jgi:hypothetical protein